MAYLVQLLIVEIFPNPTVMFSEAIGILKASQYIVPVPFCYFDFGFASHWFLSSYLRFDLFVGVFVGPNVL